MWALILGVCVQRWGGAYAMYVISFIIHPRWQIRSQQISPNYSVPEHRHGFREGKVTIHENRNFLEWVHSSVLRGLRVTCSDPHLHQLVGNGCSPAEYSHCPGWLRHQVSKYLEAHHERKVLSILSVWTSLFCCRTQNTPSAVKMYSRTVWSYSSPCLHLEARLHYSVKAKRQFFPRVAPNLVNLNLRILVVKYFMP